MNPFSKIRKVFTGKQDKVTSYFPGLNPETFEQKVSNRVPKTIRVSQGREDDVSVLTLPRQIRTEDDFTPRAIKSKNEPVKKWADIEEKKSDYRTSLLERDFVRSDCY